MIRLYRRILLFLCLIIMVPLANAQAETYTVQVASCEMRDSAESIVANLKTKGYSPYIHNVVDHDGKEWFLVRLEDFSLKASATAAAEEFNARTGSTAVVTSATTQPIAQAEPEPVSQVPSATPVQTEAETVPQAQPAPVAPADSAPARPNPSTIAHGPSRYGCWPGASTGPAHG